ncbi:Rrf2 family transcriptional regulator [Actinoalloteichus sp. AHMU CJ021]|uniref:Rrf2 family protein n=1 Tax=Actinoalloteichus caeruleus DSM 43889 TaxID=1120930 RepID=A0ABT1JI19_ACTCY|nr:MULTISPECIES: Rrf2 family transcriptional regulator [Actinoalloteichus]AUS78148.1 Rrf2 family transcriptional regulator [Actinoalloteichus sp. AHMU CJ021]MCP2332166.1 Rrf2 family protein [Actinoalloteichus caeruleus DSM 43889]
MLDIRFSSALAVMFFLAIAEEEGAPVVSSGQLAERVGANPSLVRKLLVPLGHAGLVESIKGRAGGTRLARPAEAITLAEIYRCAVGDKPLWVCRPEVESGCVGAAHASAYFEDLTARAEGAVLAMLNQETLADGLRASRSHCAPGHAG